jgi:glutamate carboxypeptidase
MEEIKKRIIDLGEAFAAEQLQLLIGLCNQNSHSTHKNGVDRVAEMIIAALDGILPHHETRKQDHLGDLHLLRNSKENPAIYLVGHMDTVFPPSHPFQSCRLQGDLLIGPGTGDMKGGLAVFLYALKILNRMDILDRLRLVLLLNGDEEIGSATSRPVFLAEREKAELCLVAECAGLHNEIVVSRNGKMAVRVTCFGQGNHVGRSAAGKSSALLEMAHKIIALEALNGCLPGVTVNVGRVEGGLGSNTVPAEASFEVDLRWEQESHQGTLLAKIQTALAMSNQPGCRSELEILNSRPAMPETNTNTEVFRRVQRLGRSLGQELSPEHRRGTSDANFFGAYGVPTLDGFGPISDRDHTPGEFIQVHSLKERTVLLSLFLLEYSGYPGLSS